MSRPTPLRILLPMLLSIVLPLASITFAARDALAQNGQNPQNGQDLVNSMNTALQRGDCGNAAAFARQILARHKYGSVEAAQANLGIGSCLLRAKRWSAAQRALRLARPLPGRAAQTRRRLEKFAAERERDEARSRGISNSNSSWSPVAAQPYWQAPAPVVMPVDPGYGKVQQKPRAAPPKVAKPPGSMNSFSVTPAINYERSDSYKSFSGLSQKSGSTTRTDNKVTVQARSESPMGYAGGDSLALSLPVELNYSQSATAGYTVSFKRNSDTATTVFGEVSEQGVTSKDFSMSASPSLTIPVTGDVELEGALVYGLNLPDFKATGKSTRRNPSANVDIELGSWKASAAIGYDERLNSSDERTSGTTTIKGSLSYGSGGQTWTLAVDRSDASIPESERTSSYAAVVTNASITGKTGTDSAEYKFQGSYSAKEPFPDVGLRAPGQLLSGLADVEIPFGVFSVGGSFTYEDLSDIVQSYTTKVDENDVRYNIAAQGGRMKFEGRFNVTAFKWLSIGMNYKYVSTDYQTNNPVVDKDFRRNNEDLSTETTVTASVSREF